MMRTSRGLAILGILVLAVLHNNWWNWQPDFRMVWGCVPYDLVYRVLWAMASLGVLWLVLRGWWGRPQ